MAAIGKKSRKPSDTSSSFNLPPESFVLFLDRNLGKHKVANILRQKGISVEIHDDHFNSDALDEEWLPKVGKKGWFVVTKDQKIRYHTIERQALKNAKVGAFVLVSKDLSGEDIGRILARALPAMRRFIEKTPRPFIAKIRRDSKVSAFLDTT